MAQIYILGSSHSYGVGGEDGGWGDILKRKLHHKMYGEGGIGEKNELYNFAKPGATIQFVLDTYKDQIGSYNRGEKKIALIAVGANNAKAVDVPDNFVSTPEEFEAAMSELFAGLVENFDKVVFAADGFVDESKTTPKINPFTGGNSYFFNERIQLLSLITKKLASEYGVVRVETGVGEEEWIEKYVHPRDGLHRNSAGHELLANQIWEIIEDELDE